MGTEIADSLLQRLLQEHPDGDNRWAAIEKAYNAESTEKRSRMWLKNRAKKVSSTEKGSDASALVSASGATAASYPMQEAAGPISHEAFDKIAQDAGVHGTMSIDNLYHKFKHTAARSRESRILQHQSWMLMDCCTYFP